MAHYVVNTKAQQEEMLKEVGLTWSDLLSTIPESVRLNRELNLPLGQSEMEVLDKMVGFQDQNTVFKTVLRGAGSYRHFIPSVVKHLASREEFVTTYTPYQSEFSQGVLQSIFEFQTMISNLMGMDASNASVYDGATAVAEAVNMTLDRNRVKALVAQTIHPETFETLTTYTTHLSTEVITIPSVDGCIDLEWLKANVDDTTACVVIQQPNYFGCLEDTDAIGAFLKEKGIQFIVSVNPMTLGLLKRPRDYHATIAVGEAQPFGLSTAFGGPYLGFMTTTDKMVRKLPGRIVGQTEDIDGKRAFALTLQAREQHIRREKSTSSICSNQAHCALTAAIYMSALGPQGLEEVAGLSYSKAHYFQSKLEALGFTLKYDQEFFHEFVTKTPIKASLIETKCLEKNILAGLVLAEDEMMWCVTEVVSDDTLDQVLDILAEVVS